MTSIPSATTWGYPTATRHALLLHGATSSSHTWHRVASSLAVKGYLVTAPNLIGHASRVSTDYHLSSFADDLRPYLEARNYSLIIGHSLGAATALSLFPHLPPLHPTAIILVDPPMQLTPEKQGFIAAKCTDNCINTKSADVIAAEHPLWTREDVIYMELGPRLCSVEAMNGLWSKNRPWNLFDYFNAVPEKWKVTVLVADPAINKLCLVEDIQPYPHVRAVMVPGAGHWIHNEFHDVVVDETLKTVAGLKMD